MRLTLDQLSDQIDLLLKEVAMTGRWLFPALQRPMDLLKSGRSPKALDLSTHLEEPEAWLKVLEEAKGELAQHIAELRKYYLELSEKNPKSPDMIQLAEQIEILDTECNFWKDFCRRAQSFLSKLKLIAAEEKFSPLARGPLQDSWEEVALLAKH